jgi:hypothetical protein
MRICKSCEQPFEAEFGRQLNCGTCKQAKTKYKQVERAQQAEQQGKFQDVEHYLGWGGSSRGGKPPGGTNRQMPEAQRTQLDQVASGTLSKVRQELPGVKLTMDDTFVIETVAETMCGFENSITKRVTFGRNADVQMLCGGHLPDAIGSAAVERVHQAPHLLLSTTFAAMYQKFLPMVLSWSKKNPEFASADLIRDVHAGIDGTFKLRPAPPVPAAQPQSPIEVSVDVSGAEIPPQGRIKFPRFDKNLTQEARDFLEGN